MRQPMQNILLELLPSQVQTCQNILLNWASLSLPASALPSPLPPAPSIALAPETRPSFIPDKASNPTLPWQH
ncbi:hypothetical protein Acr_04g0006930 [Actinidia rufa]|uniref:Uncharacterized protein n=1 Tax=Actinidia rufa TaxID=165716 RepID=A0A7J0EHJ6_9ERIC|nr:hypothetical protein Acr_04g0006930 [Actinidia rufa]